MSIHAGAHGGAAQGNLSQGFLGPLQALHTVLGLSRKSLELLSQAYRCGVL